MKPHERSPKPFTTTDLQMITEYLETDKSLKEVAEKYGVSSEGLRCKVKKYQKKQEETNSKKTKYEKELEKGVLYGEILTAIIDHGFTKRKEVCDFYEGKPEYISLLSFKYRTYDSWARSKTYNPRLDVTHR